MHNRSSVNAVVRNTIPYPVLSGHVIFRPLPLSASPQRSEIFFIAFPSYTYFPLLNPSSFLLFPRVCFVFAPFPGVVLFQTLCFQFLELLRISRGKYASFIIVMPGPALPCLPFSIPPPSLRKIGLGILAHHQRHTRVSRSQRGDFACTCRPSEPA